MKKKGKIRGYIFLELIFGIFLLGLVSVISLNLLSFSSIYYKKAEENMEIDYIAEMIIENLKAKDEVSIDFLNSMSMETESVYPLNEEYSDKYICRLLLLEENSDLWCFKLDIYRNFDKGRTSYEEFKTSIPK